MRSAGAWWWQRVLEEATEECGIVVVAKGDRGEATEAARHEEATEEAHGVDLSFHPIPFHYGPT